MASISDALTSGEGVLVLVDVGITIVASHIGLKLDTDAESAHGDAVHQLVVVERPVAVDVERLCASCHETAARA